MKKLIVISCVTTNLLLGVTIPNMSNLDTQVQPPKDLLLQEKPLVKVGGVEEYAPVMSDDISGKKVFVKRFKLTHVKNLKEEDLEKALESYNNKELSFNELLDVASVITKIYRDKGYFVARAYLPKQSVEDNIVEIAVIEGKFGDFNIENNTTIQNNVIADIYDLNKNEIISNESLERAMLLTNDLSGVKVVGVTANPGKVVGTSNFAIKTEATEPYNGYLIGDNYGSRYTGKNRLMGGVSVNSPLKVGDKLILSGLITNSSDLKNGKIAYEMPLLPNGLKGELSYSKTAYELGNDKEIEDMNLAGKSQTLEATFSYPIVRSRAETLKISSTLTKKDSQDTQNDEIKTDKRVLSLATTLSDSKSTSLFGYDAQIDSGVTLTLGSLRFDNSDAKDTDMDGAKTWGAYQKIGGNLESTIQFNPNYSIGTKFAFQHTLGDKNLDGGEDFSVGGANGVKVFPDGEHSGENGLTLSVEFFKHLPLSLEASNKIGFFYDLGYANYQNSEYNEDLKTRTLQDVGIGYYLNYKSFFMKMQMARVVGDEKIKTEEIGNLSRFLFQGGWSF